MPYYPHHSKNRWPVSDGITKQCRKCLQTKPVAEFFANRHNKDGYQTACKDCSTATTYAYRKKGIGLIRVARANRKHALKKYSLTQAEYDQMLAAQNYVCAICHGPENTLHKGQPRRLSVDHSHESGKIRGLLCMRCNQAISRMNDDPALIRTAAAYLEAHSG